MTLIDSLRSDPKFSPQKSQQWFAEKIKEMTGQTRIGSLDMLAMHKAQLTQKIMPGDMYMFTYDPKTKEKLPFYDKFPLVFPFNKDVEGFIGINLHYLKPTYRIKMLSDLMEVAKNDRYGQPQKLNLTWSYLNNAAKYPQLSTCIKRYLYGHVKSSFLKVNPNDWAMTAMLPTEKWAKGRPY